MGQALQVAAVALGLLAALLAQVALVVEAGVGFVGASLQVVLAQAHQHVAGFHPLSGLDQQFADLSADLEREVRATAGLDGAGAGIGDQGFHRAAAHFGQPNRYRIRAVPEAHDACRQGENRNDYQQLAHADRLRCQPMG
ncbi:hypothetical protein D9M70_496300 [compost metagenome]